MQRFRLIPYPAEALPKIDIAGEIHRSGNQLSIRYEVRGDVESILFPAPSAPARKHDLWKATCFEFFLAIQNQPRYWEFNLSPSGDWNAYIMDAYRQENMREEMNIQQIQVEAQKEAGGFALSTSVDLSQLFEGNQIWEAGITAVIQTKPKEETYWALAHSGTQADFHLRKSFIITL